MADAYSEIDPVRFVLATLPGMGVSSWQKLSRSFEAPSNIIEASEQELIAAGLPQSLIREILSAEKHLLEAEHLLEDLRSFEVQILYPEFPGIPDPLVRDSNEWHILTVMGNLELLNTRSRIGIVGRRQASEVCTQLTFDLSANLAARGCGILSGMAQGIDQASHLGCLSEGGGTIAVLPMGIMRFLRDIQRWELLRNALEAGKLLLISGAHPFQRWEVAEAMRRNAWIASWSDALVVVEAGTKGGTWKTATCARKKGKPVLVFSNFYSFDSGVGNDRLAQILSSYRLDAELPITDLADQVLLAVAHPMAHCSDTLFD